ncbi:MAG: hypothetical protein R6W77_12615 [Trueperaceae bacterium]
MWANLSHTQWIALAWGQLILAYVGYLVYLGWRARRAREGEDRR